MYRVKCCPLWAIVSAVVAVAAIATIAILVVKKMHMLKHGTIITVDEAELMEAELAKADSDEIPNANDKDFV
jgi:hypothetical protein